MDRRTEERWRTELQSRGKAAIQAELELVPGQPADLVYTIGDGPPFPSRAFCEAWVRGKPPRPIGLSGNTAVLIGASLLAIACIAGAVSGFMGGDQRGANAPSAAAPRPSLLSGAGGGNGPPDDAVRNAAKVPVAGDQTILPSCTNVSKSGDVRTVQSQRPCRPPGPASALNQNQSGGRP